MAWSFRCTTVGAPSGPYTISSAGAPDAPRKQRPARTWRANIGRRIAGSPQGVEAVARPPARQGRAPERLPRTVERQTHRWCRPHLRAQLLTPRIVAASLAHGIDPAMGDPQSSTGAPRAPEASAAALPLHEGIVRVKVPGEKILPFLARVSLFKNAPKEVVTKVSTLLQGLECADGSEVVSAVK